MSEQRVKLVTPSFTLAFARVFKVNKSDKPKYTIGMVFPEEANLKHLEKLAQDTFSDKFPKKKLGAMTSPFKSGDDMYDRDDRYENMAGCTVVNAARNADFGPIPCVDQQQVPIMESDDEIYNGAICRAFVSAYAWEYQGKCGVSFNIEGLQKIKDGERIGGKVDLTTVFGAVTASEDDESADEMEMNI